MSAASASVASNQKYGLRDHDLFFSAPGPRNYLLRVKDLPDDERPRERLLQAGPASLSVAELVAVIWGVGSRKEDVLAMAQRTLKEYGEKTISHELDPHRLAEAANIPLTKACQVVAGFELGRRYYANQAGRPAQVRNAKQAYQYMKSIGSSQKEQLRGLYLNSQYQVIHDEVISIGSLTSNIVHPREVFQPAIERGAVAVILAHNHPSGRVEATNADIQVTEQLVAAGDILGIELLDHLIITTTRYVSVMDCLPDSKR
ncbi:MAG TPA: DNA repair protein RadC [Candidatus Saccharimonadales bacterium]|nr:DNA repair protein RadC [Candidatus Saccharimonadales bacterium]